MISDQRKIVSIYMDEYIQITGQFHDEIVKWNIIESDCFERMRALLCVRAAQCMLNKWELRIKLRDPII